MVVRSVTVRYQASVGRLVSELNRAAKANDQLAKSTEDAGKSTEKTGKKLDTMALAGGAIALGLGIAVSKFAEFDAAMSRAAAGTGATGDELNKLRDAAIEAGQATQFSATDAANAITELGKAGVSTTDILNGGLTGALNLAAAGQLDVGQAAEFAATTLKQFNLQGSETSHVADLLAAGAGKAVGSVQDMALALKQVGTVAHGFGLSVEETVGGLTAFAAAGLIGQDAGTSFKSLLQRLVPQSQQAADLMQNLGINAFTAGGSFKGLAAFAGNLQDSLKGLTPEQRAAAEATIFGSDAVRAANVLYEQGQAGIEGYTKAVNDNGFAARQAATLTDNLKGDLERLGGAFETNLIKAGSGANDSLRTLVQTGEDLLNIIGEIPGPVIAGAAAFGALALVGPKVGALAKTIAGPLTGAVSRFRDELAISQSSIVGYGPQLEGAGDKALKAGEKFRAGTQAAGKAVGGLKGAASGVLGILGGPWGIALGAATVAVTAFATAQQNAQTAGQEFSDTLDQQTGAITDLSRAFVGKKLTFDLSPEDITALQKYGISLGDVTQKILDGGPQVNAYIDHLRELAGQADAPNAALAGLASSVEHTSADVERGRAILEAHNTVLGDTAQSVSAADRKFADLTGTTDAYVTSAAGANTASSDLSGGIDDVAVSAEDAAKQMQDLINAFDTLGGGTRAVRAAQRGLAQDIADLATAGKQDAKGTKTKAELAAEYQAAVDKVGESTANLISKQAEEGASVGTLKNIYDTQRAAVEKSLAAHGFHGKKLQEETDKIVGTRDRFNDLLLEYAKNPGTVAANITTPGLDESKKKVEGYWEVINGVPTFIKTKADADTAGAVSDINIVSGLVRSLGAQVAKPKIAPYVDDESGKVAERQLAWLARNRSSTISVRIASTQAANVRATLRDIRGFNTGGAVPGVGIGDKVPALLEPQEHVLTRREVAAAGGHEAIYRMRKAILSGDARFAVGGAVDVLGARTGSSVRRRASMRGGVAGYRYGGPVSSSGGMWGGIDYARLSKAVVVAAQNLKHPELHFVSGEDARVAAVQGVREFYFQRDRG